MIPPNPNAKFHAFTFKANGRLRALTSLCRIEGVIAGGLPAKEFTAIWDTGATNSVISGSVAADCGLVPTGMTKTHGVGGEHICETYVVNIQLHNGPRFTGLRVTRGDLKGADVLIGMDIIGMGDFAVTNRDGLTAFSFRVPSKSVIDFVAQDQAAQKQSHGGAPQRQKKSGKKFGKNK